MKNLTRIGEQLDQMTAPDWVYTWYGCGPHLTCREVETIARLLLANDGAQAAQALMDGHAAGDERWIDGEDCGDLHGMGSPWEALDDEAKLALLAA